MRRPLKALLIRLMNDRIPAGLNPTSPTRIGELSDRSRDIFRSIVESYLETGEPIGSRTLSQRGIALSPASITFESETDLLPWASRIF